MDFSEFRIGMAFTNGQTLWRCTDVGTRVVVGIRLDNRTVCHNEPLANGAIRTWIEEIDPRRHPEWLTGPPYAVAEVVFDEYDLETCVPVEDVQDWKPDPLPEGFEVVQEVRS